MSYDDERDMRERFVLDQLMRMHPGHAEAWVNGRLMGAWGPLGGPCDLEGRPVKRTKREHPYNYDGFVVTRKRPNAEAMECAYTDRMWGWDRPKMKRLCDKHMKGYRWDNCPSDIVEAFLSEWAEDPGLQLIAVMEWCNQATGYPTWSLHWVHSKKKLKEIAEKSRKEAYERGCYNFKCERKFQEGDEVVLDESRGYAKYYCKGCEPKKEEAP